MSDQTKTHLMLLLVFSALALALCYVAGMGTLSARESFWGLSSRYLLPDQGGGILLEGAGALFLGFKIAGWKAWVAALLLLGLVYALSWGRLEFDFFQQISSIKWFFLGILILLLFAEVYRVGYRTSEEVLELRYCKTMEKQCGDQSWMQSFPSFSPSCLQTPRGWVRGVVVGSNDQYAAIWRMGREQPLRVEFYLLSQVPLAQNRCSLKELQGLQNSLSEK